MPLTRPLHTHTWRVQVELLSVLEARLREGTVALLSALESAECGTSTTSGAGGAGAAAVAAHTAHAAEHRVQLTTLHDELVSLHGELASLSALFGGPSGGGGAGR